MNLHDIAAEGAAKQAQSEAEAFENAIKRIRPKEESMNINGKWYTESEIQAYVNELESKVTELEAKHHNECAQIAHYSDELREHTERVWVMKSDVLDLITAAYEDGGFKDYSDYDSLWYAVDDM